MIVLSYELEERPSCHIWKRLPATQGCVRMVDLSLSYRLCLFPSFVSVCGLPYVMVCTAALFGGSSACAWPTSTKPAAARAKLMTPVLAIRCNLFTHSP